MTSEQIYEEIRQLLINKFEVEESKITPKTNIVVDLDFDSIDIVDMIVELNKKIKLKVSADDFKQVRTIEDVATTLYSLLQNNASK